jgi:hypothetical protein
MTAPERETRESFWPMLAALGVVVVCCAGPVVLALLATAGVGIAAVRTGSVLLGGAAVAAALVIAGLVWRRRRACATPGVPRALRAHEPPYTPDGDAPRRTHASARPRSGTGR